MKLLNKRSLILILIILIVSFTFWGGSRYPSLQKKAALGDHVSTSAISFDTVLTYDNETFFGLRVVFATINWLYTNMKGMTFGLLLAAGILALLIRFRPRPGKSSIVNSLKGILVGSPLGVCANCVTPIGKGLYDSGVKVDTVLAIMFSSPTFNIVVLSMLFTLYPIHMACTKVILTLVLIICVVPVLSSYFSKNQIPEKNTSYEKGPEESWMIATCGAFVDYVRSLWKIIYQTVPFMILAGFLGAFLVELFPFDAFGAMKVSLLSVFLVAIIGTFLPVPIIFDIILVQSLMQKGFPAGLSMILLFCLGIYSVFPFVIIWRGISKKLALFIYLAVMLLGIVGGILIHAVDARQNAEIMYVYKEMFGERNISIEKVKNIVAQECSLFSNSSHFKGCVEGGMVKSVREIAVNYKSPRLCNQLDERLINKCIMDSLSFLVWTDFDLNWCNISGDPDIQNACEKRAMKRALTIDHWKTMALIRGDNFCAELNNEEAVFYCLNAELFSRAIDLKDPSICMEIVDSQLQQECLTKIRNISPEEENVLGVEMDCVRIYDHRQKMECIEGRIERKIAGSLSDIGIFTNFSRKILENRQNNISDLKAPNLSSPKSLISTAFYSSEDYKIDRLKHHVRHQHNTSMFTKNAAADYGILYPNEFTLLNLDVPFFSGRGIASGDYNNDHLQDILLASNHGVLLYKNLGNGWFQHISLELNLSNVFIVGFVDINNDFWQDIFITTYGGENYIFLNDQRGFRKSEKIKFRKESAILTRASSFGDLDKDGNLDVIFGNWPVEESSVFLNKDLSFMPLKIASNIGYTLTTLLSDITGDDNLDLIVGNDRKAPDKFYLGDGKGHLEHVTKKDKLISYTAFNPMSIDTADFDNDLKLEIYMVDMNFTSPRKSMDYCSLMDSEADRERCSQFMSFREIVRRNNINQCSNLSPQLEQECAIAIYMSLAIKKRSMELCEDIPSVFRFEKLHCTLRVSESANDSSGSSEDLSQKNVNVLLSKKEGRYVDIGKEVGVHSSDWGWNAKFADLDNDQWQDIYAGNGFIRLNDVTSNIFFHNEKGVRFTQKQKEFGLQDYIQTNAYTYTDIDNDGDLDIIAMGVLSSPRVFINNESRNNTISFKFRDYRGNSFGIGNKVYIYYGKDSQLHQVREIKSGGGYMSFDAPIAHFGLGKYGQANKVVVHWSTGEKASFEKAFLSGFTYIITRQENIL